MPVQRARLRRAAEATGGRFTLARITGLTYAPVAASRGPESGAITSLRAEAGRILRASSAPHLRGQAFLLSGQTEAAIAQLKDRALARNPEALSDLAAAQLTASVELDARELALDAVVSARNAIALAPDLAAAHFNLGLALERLGLTIEARAEMESSAALEREPEWAREAERRAALPARASLPWTVAEPLLKSTDDPKLRNELIRGNVSAARRSAEGPYLASWAAARVAGDVVTAAAILDFTRVIGAVLLEAGGDRFVADAVGVIDRAEAAGNETAMRVARAHLVYRDGRVARRNRLTAQAIDHLTRAGAELAAVGSPLQYAARYYIAGALYEEGRIDEAMSEFDALVASNLSAKGYRSLRAQVEWDAGSCRLVRGAYAEALQGFNHGHEESVALDDRDLAASFDGLVAEALEYLGESREAWRRRSRALRAYSAAGMRDSRKLAALVAASNSQIASRNWERAEALLDYVTPLATSADSPEMATMALAQRSVVRDELGDSQGARDDRFRADLWLQRIPDTAMRERLRVELDIARGIATRHSSPREAVLSFTRAIDLLSTSGQKGILPRLYLERARAHQQDGNLAATRRDLRAGLDVIAGWERSTSDAEQRVAIGIWGQTMRRDLILLELGAGDVAAAFAVADGGAASRERSTPLSLHEVQRALNDHAAIAEIVTARDRVVVFIIRRDAARALTLSAGSARIAAAAEKLRDADDERFPEAAAALHELLVAPLLPHLKGVSTLGVIPPRELTGLSLGACRDAVRDRYLVEELAIVHDSSASAAIASSRRAREGTGSTTLAIGASAFDPKRGAAALPNVDEEAATIASLSPSARRLLGSDATPAAVERELAEASTVHFAGHIVDRGADARILLAPAGNRDSLTARDVSRLRLGNTRVVVLAACRGSANSDAHAIVRDMASGFLAAGVSSVIASATDVDDTEAPPTMRRLHSFLALNHDAAEALTLTARMDREAGRTVPLSVRLLVMGGSPSLVQ